MGHARLVADLVDHELDARREAIHLEPVREGIDIGAVKKSSKVLSRRFTLRLLMAVPR